MFSPFFVSVYRIKTKFSFSIEIGLVLCYNYNVYLCKFYFL